MPFVYVSLWAQKHNLNPVPSGSEINYWADTDAAIVSGVLAQLTGNLNLVSASLSATISSTIPALSSALSSTNATVAVLSGNIVSISASAYSASVSASSAVSAANAAIASASDLSSTIGAWDIGLGTVTEVITALSTSEETQNAYLNDYLNRVAGTGSGWPASGSTYATGSGGLVISGSMSATLDYVQQGLAELSDSVAVGAAVWDATTAQVSGILNADLVASPTGVYLRSTDGTTVWRLTIDNSGVLSTTFVIGPL